MNETIKIVVPEHIGDITLGQFQKYTKLQEREDLNDYEFSKRKLSIFLNIPYNKLDSVKLNDFKHLLNDIDIALSKEHKFVDRFEINGIEFGFIPNFDNITAKEFADFSLYPTDNIETYHNLMAILFRPVTHEDAFKNYQIASYKGTSDYAEIMKQTPMSIVDGALVFFCDLSKELRKSIQRYTREALEKAHKQQTTLKSGVGTLQ